MAFKTRRISRLGKIADALEPEIPDLRFAGLGQIDWRLGELGPLEPLEEKF